MTVEKEPVLTFENEGDEVLGIQTKTYPNGNKVKQITLSDGRIATVRTLFGRDNVEITRRLDGKEEKYENALMSVAVKIDDKDLVIEDLDDIPFKDYNKIKIANSRLNFV